MNEEMKVQENVLNGILAEVLHKHCGFSAVAEARMEGISKRCDIQVREQHDHAYFTAIECKTSQDVKGRKNAVADAKRWFELSPDSCWNAVAVCYPEEIVMPAGKSLCELIGNTKDLLMAKVSPRGVIEGKWIRGGV